LQDIIPKVFVEFGDGVVDAIFKVVWTLGDHCQRLI
jgi:hypothetical protein